MTPLGSKVKDRISGYKGIATSRIEYLNGCVRIVIQAPVSKDGKLPNYEYFDEEDIVVLKTDAVASVKSGGAGRPVPPAREAS